MPLTVIRKDITKVKADAIVSASGHSFASHGAVSTAIFRAAGPGLREECDRTGSLDTAEVLVTGAYDLSAKAVIHTVGPSWQDSSRGEAVLLRKCYENCLKAAREHGLKSVAFPLISSGGCHFPKEHALKTAMEAIAGYEHFDEMDVILAVCDRDSYEVSRELLDDISDYVGRFPAAECDMEAEDLSFPENMSRTGSRRPERRRRPTDTLRMECSCTGEEVPPLHGKIPANIPPELVKQLEYRDESFSEMLNRLILERDVKSSSVYKAANVSRAVFSNIFTKKNYKVKKGTALALAIALRLDLDQTKLFLAKAGHALSDAFRQDKIVEYFIVHEIYNVFEINEVLFFYDLPELGEKTW